MGVMGMRLWLEAGTIQSLSSEKGSNQQRTCRETSLRCVLIGTINNRNKLIHVFTQTPSILSKNEFRTFWIKTTATTISVGRGGVTAPFMIYSLEKSNPRINYVAFSSWGPHSGQWKILPHNIQFTTNGYNFKYYLISKVTDLQAGIFFSASHHKPFIVLKDLLVTFAWSSQDVCQRKFRSFS